MKAIGIKPEDLQIHKANLAILQLNSGSQINEVKSALKEANKREIKLEESEVYELS
jgi:hypothetical protein